MERGTAGDGYHASEGGASNVEDLAGCGAGKDKNPRRELWATRGAGSYLPPAGQDAAAMT